MMSSRNKNIATWSAATLITFLIICSEVPAATRGIVIKTQSESGAGKEIQHGQLCAGGPLD